eukprot:1038088-Ditylum_brightwellii.AAC.1
MDKEEKPLYDTSEAGGNVEKTLNFNHSPQESNSNTGMESSIRNEEEPKIYRAGKGDSIANDSSYYGPTLHEEEIISSYSSYSGLKLDSSDIDIVMNSSI